MVLGGYSLLAILLTWPLVRDFKTYTIGEVPHDIRHAIWVLWYTKEALLLRASWPWTTMLHYPHGISLLCDGVGPLNAVFSLPYWHWGRRRRSTARF